MANIFLSHHDPDASVVEQLVNELRYSGHHVWFDEWEINVGDSIVERIEQCLNGMNYLVLCYSASGMSTLARQLSGSPVKTFPVLPSGGGPPAIVMGRKVWLFSDTPKGAQASAIHYSLIETAKANGLEPYAYLTHVLKALPYADTVEKIEALLPWNFKNQVLST
jgi:hypothetical protein